MHPAESASDLPESESQLMSEEPTPDTIVLDSNDTAIYTGIAALNGTVPWFAAWCQANLPSGSMQPSGHPSLAAVSLLLKTHIFNGLLYSPSFVDGRTLTSHAGLQFTLGCVGGGWKIGGAEVVHTDILSKNAGQICTKPHEAVRCLALCRSNVRLSAPVVPLSVSQSSTS